jgi:hypothetical protein
LGGVGQRDVPEKAAETHGLHQRHGGVDAALEQNLVCSMGDITRWGWAYHTMHRALPTAG